MLFDGADDAEAVDDFVANKFGVVAADFAVVKIVVFAAVFDERGEGGGQFLRLVFGNEVHDVIGDQGGKPAHVFACCFKVVGGPDGGGGHDFDLAEVAAGFLDAFADEAEAPVDQVGVSELEDHAVADASGGAQGFGAVAGDPDAGGFAAGPREFRGDAVEVDGFAGVQVAEDANKFLEIFERSGLLAEDAAGAVAAADAKFHATVGSEIERGEEAGGDGGNAYGGGWGARGRARFFWCWRHPRG